jgi:hypothetical protein
MVKTPKNTSKTPKIRSKLLKNTKNRVKNTQNHSKTPQKHRKTPQKPLKMATNPLFRRHLDCHNTAIRAEINPHALLVLLVIIRGYISEKLRF